MIMTRDLDGTWAHTIDVGQGHLYYGTGYTTKIGCWWDGWLIQTVCRLEDWRTRRAMRRETHHD